MESNELNKYVEIGRRIEESRLKESLTQSQLAERLNYQSPTAISLIEAGKRKIKITELEKIAQILHQDFQYLMTGKSEIVTDVRLSLRSQHKDLTKNQLDQIEAFINFIKNKNYGRASDQDKSKNKRS